AGQLIRLAGRLVPRCGLNETNRRSLRRSPANDGRRGSRSRHRALFHALILGLILHQNPNVNLTRLAAATGIEGVLSLERERTGWGKQRHPLTIGAKLQTDGTGIRELLVDAPPDLNFSILLPFRRRVYFRLHGIYGDDLAWACAVRRVRKS